MHLGLFTSLFVLIPLRIAVDPIFPPPIPWQTSKKFLCPENPQEYNRFELIFDERKEGHELKKLQKEVRNISDNQAEFSEIEE